MQWPGHLTFTLRLGERFLHVPNHLDYVLGATRPASSLDGGGAIDNAVNKWGGGGRTLGVYPSSRGLGRAGEHGEGFNDTEEQLGFSRTYRLHIADPNRTREVRDALRDLAIVESASIQMLATAPLSLTAVTHDSEISASAMEPYRRLRIPEAHALEPGDKDITVAVVDTGVSLGHPELQRKCLAGYNTVDLGLGQLNPNLRLVGDSWGIGFHPEDRVGHGSMVAGIIGAQGWHVPYGAAALSLILPVRVLAAAQSSPDGPRVGVGSLADIDAGMKVALDLGADVINASFGTPASAIPEGDPLPPSRIISYAKQHGCTVVAAAGNKGDDDKYYPAALPGVIAVGSVDASDTRSRFSSYGDHLCVCAPGEQIFGLARRGYRVNSGTSFSSPFVAGIVALLLSRARRVGIELDSDGIRRVLIETAKPLAGGGFHPETGYGLVDALAAVRRVDAIAAQKKSSIGRKDRRSA